MKIGNDDFVVILIGYSRIDLLRKRLEEVICLTPPNVFVSIDYSNPKRIEEITRLLRTFAQLWPKNSRLEYVLQERNLGLAEHVTQTISTQLRKYRNAIIIEDDITFTEQFYNAAKEYIYDDQLRKQFISFGGFSIWPPYTVLEKRNLFRQSPYFSCWGWVVSRENWVGYELNLSEINLSESLNHSKLWNQLTLEQQNTWLGRFEKIRMNPKLTWDIQFQFHSFKSDKPHLVPIYRLVENEGFNDSRSTNTKGNRPLVFGNFRLPTVELSPRLAGKLTTKILTWLDSAIFLEDRKIISKSIRLIRGRSGLGI
jgi:hypothetical protein